MARNRTDGGVGVSGQNSAQERKQSNGKATTSASSDRAAPRTAKENVAAAVRLWQLRHEKRDLIPTWEFRPEDDLSIERKRKRVSKKRARRREVTRIVKEGLEGQRAQMETNEILRSSKEKGPIRPLQRRKVSKSEPTTFSNPPIFKDQQFKATVWATFWRCIVWIKVVLVFQFGVLWDRMRKRDTVATRAVRFYHVFQSAGGSFTKIGQQLAMRLDLFPEEYCSELSKLLDNVQPFPAEQAIAIIERATGKPLGENFAAFDPKPIGAATIACVYQAVLKTGEKVAVKVRRPDIGTVFAADLRAMRWMESFLEMFALIRAGYMDNFISEFSATIIEELDFRMEAYHQAMFRREAKKNKIGRKGRFTAPRVYFQYSNQEVLVQEFASGIWMWEILAAVEHHDTAALARMRQLNINPKDVSKSLYWVSLWSQLIAPMFHADPHPANIVVQRNSKLVFIDFGACGSLSKGKRKLAQEFVTAHARKDVGSVVRCTVAFMEPLPPVDLHSVLKELEMMFAGALHRMWSKHAPWYEKNSAGFYFRLFEITRKYDIPVSLDTVRAFRANMLYDTLAVRIHPKLDPVDGMRKFLVDCDKELKRSGTKSLQKRLASGLISGREVATLNDVQDITERVLGLARRFLDRPQFSFNYMVEKSVFAVMEFVRFCLRLAGLAVTITIIVIIYRIKNGLPIDAAPVFANLWKHPVFIAVIVLEVVISTRRIMMRLSDSKI